MKFIATQVYEIDRKLEIETEELFLTFSGESEVVTYRKQEEITLSIKLISSGDTSKFTSDEVCSIILEKLREITKP